MNHTQIKLESLLKISLNIKFDAQYIVGKARLNNQSDCDLIQEFENRSVPDLGFDTDSYDFNVGDEIDYRIALHDTGNQYASYQNFILHRFDLTRSDDVNSPFIIYEDHYLVGKGEKSISDILKLFSLFLKCLSEKYYYRDNQIIFFSKTHCEVVVQPRSYDKYVDLAKVYNELNLSEILTKFIDWMSADVPKSDNGVDETLSLHQSERYAIAATEFVDHLITFNKNEKLFMLLKNIDDIYKSIISKYSLYLEDFKYSKFTDKITEYSDEFLNKVNKIISDLQTQILAVPLAVSFITVFKKNDEVNQFIYIGFLVYLFMVFYSCCQQAYNLKHIEMQINQFNKIAKLPKELSSQWDVEINPVLKKIFLHKIFFLLLSLFIGVLIGICIINIKALNDFYVNSIVFILIFSCVLIKLFRFYTPK